MHAHSFLRWERDEFILLIQAKNRANSAGCVEMLWGASPFALTLNILSPLPLKLHLPPPPPRLSLLPFHDNN